MATALTLDFASLTLEDYDATCEALDFPASWPDGLISHAAANVGGRLRVYDVWESREHFDRFVEERLRAALGQALGDRAEPPQVSEQPLHTAYGR